MQCNKAGYRYYFTILIISFLFTAATYTGTKLCADDHNTKPDNFYYRVAVHNLDVRLDVNKHVIFARDEMHILLSNRNDEGITLMLNSNLKVNKIFLKGMKELTDWETKEIANHIQAININLPKLLDDKIILQIEYKGEIYDPVIKAKELGHLRGDVTAGLICDEGIYLAASTYWYPISPNSRELSIFDVTVKIISPYVIVTQGELVKREVKDGLSTSIWQSNIPADGLALVGGKYVIHTKTVNDIKVSTYFFKEDDSMSEIFLNAALDYIKLYSDLLGDYPYKKFDVVENFFSTGYGMPSYTLLGNYVIKRGHGSLQPGYLDHEIVHSWFGNYLFNDASKGNWVEALTTYCANYLYKELKLGKEDAENHRKNAALKYSIRVKKDQGYPVHEFVTKTKPYDNEIGYTKGSMFFHQIRRKIGDENFFKGLKTLVRTFGSKYAEWEDLQSVFESVSKKDLGGLFFQWIDIADAPQLKLENITHTPTEKGYKIKGNVAQLGNVYNLSIPIHIDLGNSVKTFTFGIDSKRATFEYEVDEMPLKITLDPEYHLFRRISEKDFTPCFNALLEDQNSETVFIYPSKEDDAGSDIYNELCKTATARVGGESITPDEFDNRMLQKSIFITGNARNEEKCQKLFSSLPDGVQLDENSFTIYEKQYKGPEYALLLTFRNPMNSSSFVTTYFGLSPEAVSRARYIFFYGWNSYVVFKNGRPIRRGEFSSTESDTIHNFTTDMTRLIDPAIIKKHVKYLASEKLEGRYPGTKGDIIAKDYIKKKLHQCNIPYATTTNKEHYEQTFGIKIPDLKEFSFKLNNKDKETLFSNGIPFNFSPASRVKAELFFAGYGIKNAEYSDYADVNMDDTKGKAIVIIDDASEFLEDNETDPIDLLFKKIETAQEMGAAAVILFSSDEQKKKYAPYTAYKSNMPPHLTEIISRKKEKGSFSSTDMELVGLAAKGKTPDVTIKMPVILASYEDPEYKHLEKKLKLLHMLQKNKKTAKDKNRSTLMHTTQEKPKSYSHAVKSLEFELNLEFKTNEIPTFNIVGALEGKDPILKDEAIVIGAHYDHLGRDEKGNVFFGADDNASGIGAFLEIARTFSAYKDHLKRTVIFVAFGAEEWGLTGSRYFVNNPVLPDKKIVSMLNMDSIGRGDPFKVWTIGSSFYPELGQTAGKYIKECGLVAGDNIDKYAFKHGSDHYPFHLKGISSIDFFATNYREMHKITDTWDSVDNEKVAKVSRLVFMTLYDLATR